jgi:hypothetical protein
VAQVVADIFTYITGCERLHRHGELTIAIDTALLLAWVLFFQLSRSRVIP